MSSSSNSGDCVPWGLEPMMSSRAAGVRSQAALTKYYRRSSTSRKSGRAGKLAAYPVAPTVSPAAHSACRQLHAIDGLFAEPSQYAPQYLLPGAAGQLQPGCAHFSIFFSAIETPLAPFSVAEKHTPTLTQNQSRLNPAHRTWKIPRRESLTTPPKPFAPMIKSDSKSLGASWLKEP